MISKKPTRILIADDDINLLSMLKESLSMQGFDVHVSLDGEGALAKAKTGVFDLVLLDIMMPRRDGYDVAAQLRTDLGHKTPKIVFISCRNKLAEAQHAFDVGGVDILQKPFTLKELTRSVRRALMN